MLSVGLGLGEISVNAENASRSPSDDGPHAEVAQQPGGHLIALAAPIHSDRLGRCPPRYNTRTDVPSVYLAQVPDYLLHLLDGGESGGRVMDSVADDVPYEPDPFRAWFMISYATFLKAASLHCEQLNSRRERVERFATWLEHELRISPGQEAWIGFKLLAGRGDQPGKAARLLKLGRPQGIADAVWGATWDLMYTRIPQMMNIPPAPARNVAPSNLVRHRRHPPR